LNNLPAEYDNAVYHVRNLMAIREMVKGGDIESITNLDDAVKINYDISWLPPYKELRVGLINAWLSKKRRWDEEKTSRNKEGHPTMMIGDGGQAEKTCFGCGLPGLLRGSPECRAGKDAVWGGAPKTYLLDKIQKKFGKTPTNGKRQMQEVPKQICKFHQEGFYKYAYRCHFLHEGKGGSKRPREMHGNGKGKSKGKGKGKGRGKGLRKENNRRTTMVLKKKEAKSKDGDESFSIVIGKAYDAVDDDVESDCEEELYNLMRGHTSIIIADVDSEEEENEGDSDGEQELPPTESLPRLILSCLVLSCLVRALQVLSAVSAP
jgi:hypothetical protein